jgi:hypothetical protein
VAARHRRGLMLVDGTECKMITGVDDHSRFCVIASVVPRATRAVAVLALLGLEVGLAGRCAGSAVARPTARHGSPGAICCASSSTRPIASDAGRSVTAVTGAELHDPTPRGRAGGARLRVGGPSRGVTFRADGRDHLRQNQPIINPSRHDQGAGS